MVKVVSTAVVRQVLGDLPAEFYGWERLDTGGNGREAEKPQEREEDKEEQK